MIKVIRFFLFEHPLLTNHKDLESVVISLNYFLVKGTEISLTALFRILAPKTKAIDFM